MNYIVSIATVPKRIDYFKKSFKSILKQTFFNRISKVIINVDDTITDEEFYKYDFLKEYPIVEIVKRPSKWRSANKLIWTYMDNMNDVIITFDDDKDYPLDCIEELIRTNETFGDIIISEESNPVTINNDGRIEFINIAEIHFGQYSFSKYLSNACLFPSKCFGDGKLLTDYDKFYESTEATHDELWFWVVSTLNGIYNYRLNSTYSYEGDGTTYKLDEIALSHINSNIYRIKKYNDKINEMFGKELTEIFETRKITFPLTISNFESVILGMPYIYNIYGNFGINLIVSNKLKKSHINLIYMAAKNYHWKRGFDIKLQE